MSNENQPPFVGFNKIARLNRHAVITEKIDGTNGQVHITEDGQVLAGSRSRWITPEDDNQGFARWVAENKEELLLKLGPGHHFGEWWGAGIQRRYGLKEKRFSLFNVARWGDPAIAPSCCYAVPILATGLFSTEMVEEALSTLRVNGSFAAPGFMKPEGIVIFHAHANQLFKVTLENDAEAKSQAASKSACAG